MTRNARSRLFLLLWLGASSLARGAESTVAGAPILFGNQQAAYWFHSNQPSFRFPDYENNGYRQYFQEGKKGWDAHVLVKVESLGCDEPARVVGPLGPRFEVLRIRLNREKRLLANQVQILFSWMRETFEQEQILNPDQDLESVMGRKSANCVGLANIALYVLRQMNLECRYVTGVAFRNRDEAKLLLEGVVLHRWVEIHYPGVGWVFADPARSAHFVEATYLVIGIEGLHPIEVSLEAALGSQLELLSFRNGLKMIGHVSGLDPGMRLRPLQ